MSRKRAADTETHDRWWYLTASLRQIVKTHRALMYTPYTMTPDEPMGWVEPREEYWLPVIVNPALSESEREYAFRGLLAERDGIDVTDWPVLMTLPGGARPTGTEARAASASGLARWDFLTMPYDDLLYTLGVTVLTRPAPDDWPAGREFMAGVMVTPSGQFSHVIAAPNLVGLEREYTIRGLLAKWHGADATNWPVTMTWARKGVPDA